MNKEDGFRVRVRELTATGMSSDLAVVRARKEFPIGAKVGEEKTIERNPPVQSPAEPEKSEPNFPTVGNLPKPLNPQRVTVQRAKPTHDQKFVKLELADSFDGQVPEESWTLAKMQEYALAQHQIDQQLEHTGGELLENRAVRVHRLGHALTLIKPKCGHGRWMTWRKQHGLSKGRVDRAIDLYRAVPDEKLLGGIGIQKAYRQFGVTKPKPNPKPDLLTTGKQVKPAMKLATDTLFQSLDSVDEVLVVFGADPDRLNREKIEAAVARLLSQAERMRDLLQPFMTPANPQ